VRVRKLVGFLLLTSSFLFSQTGSLIGQPEELPRHLINPDGALSQPSGDTPVAIARKFLDSVAPALGLGAEDLAGVYVAKEYRTEHNGVTHVLFRQSFDGVDVHGAAYKINIDRDGRVLNAGGDLMKRPAMAAAGFETGSKALQAAVRTVNPKLDGSYLAAPAKGDKYTKFSRGGFADETEGKPVWFSVRGELRSAWLFYVAGEDGISRYATIVDATTQRVLQSVSLTRNQRAPAPAQGLVFERESPQPNPTPGVRNETRPYVQRSLRPFTGDPIASPNGWVTGTETIGNNVIAGSNPNGVNQITNPVPAVASDRNFSFPLELGPGAPSLTSYANAATTNLFYWANRAHDSFYRFGFDEAAGNFQQENLGRGGVGGDPVLAYSQFGVAATRAAQVDNAYFLANRDFEDGARVSINMFIWASENPQVFSDGSFDAEVIVHEYTHGVSNRLVEGAYETHQGWSMGEAWSDYFGLEFTLPEGAPGDGYYPIGEYAFQNFGLGIRTRPYSTNIEINPLTFGRIGRVIAEGPEVHADGEIWMAALWEARAALIRQFGEKEGRRRMAQIVIDAMKLSPPRPTMLDARDAILLADRAGFRGESQKQLWEAFAKRGFGAVAHSATPDSISVTQSFAMPSNKGTLRFEYDKYSLGELVRVILHDGNNPDKTVQVQLTSATGDLENLVLRKKGEEYYGSIRLGADGYSQKGDSALDVIPGDFINVYYVDMDTGGGAELIQTSAEVTPAYSVAVQPPAPIFTSGRENPVFAVFPGGRQTLNASRVTLPFPFRFYGGTYRSMWIYGDGRLSFDAPVTGNTYVSNACNDASGAVEIPTIAPMWMELMYGGSAQKSENVYFSTGPGSVTVRWAAETVSTGEPVNFSAVLYEDGRIMYQYGDGNNDLVNSPFFGCTANTPLIGISNGRGTFVQTVAAYLGLANLEMAPPVILDPPFNSPSAPLVRIESPEEGGRYSGIVTVKGIAYDPEVAIARLDVLLDGIPRRGLLAAQPRIDVCAVEPLHGCPAIGFQTTIDLNAERLAPGPHTIWIRATNTRGSLSNYPDRPITITVEPGQSRQPVGRIEIPADGAAMGSRTVGQGYVYAPDVRIRSVDVIVDGITYGQATYGQRRDDICATLDPRPPNCPGVGFTFSLNASTGALPLPNGKHLLQVRARDEADRFTLIPEVPLTIEVSNAENKLPTGIVLNPAPNTKLKGIVKIWGWAWDPDGTIRQARLRIDGLTYMTLNYGEERAEQCTTLPDVKACPNIGFWGDFDTSLVSNGVHELGVVLVDDKGASAVIPRLSRGGMNVIFDN
jgi:hypothetical protein